MNLDREKVFGTMPNGTQIMSYTLTNANGMSVTIITYGATVTSIVVPTPRGPLDVVLGFDTIQDYMHSIDLEAPPYFGAAVGRWAGRLNGGKFNLNGKTYNLEPNNNGNLLHGGRMGFSQRVWELKEVDYNKPSITLSYFSPDGDEHFPGDLYVTVTYSLSSINELLVEYRAFAQDDTIINLTHHSYFNLNGHKSEISNQKLFVNAENIVETNEMIPTGEFLEVSNTPYNFTTPDKCPQTIDATFVLEETPGPAGTLYSPDSGLKLSVFTNQPALHIYVGGDCFNKILGKDGANYHSLSGICFETQNFPDAPNHPNFPDPVLRAGEEFIHKTIYRFSHDSGINK